MSSSTTTPPTRRHAGRLKRIVLTAAAVGVGAIVLSGCVVIQSESALQASVIGNSITITTTLCASQAAAAAPCNSPGTSNKLAVSGTNASAPGQLLVGYRIPAGVTAPATISTSVPSTDENNNPISVPLTLTQSASYAAGLTGLLGAPAGTQWVGYVSEVQSYASNGPQTVTIAPSFGLPDGFTGAFTWRTVVGYRPAYFQAHNLDVTCPAPFPGAVASPIPDQSSVCVDYPDGGTVQGPASSYAIGSLSIVAPATPSIAAGSSATLGFTGLFSGSNPTSGVFAVAASTTLPGVTPTVTPTFAPAANSSNPLTVSLAIPASTPVGTYDVTVSATIAGMTRSATGHITVKEPIKSTASATAGNAAKLTSSIKKTTLKVARATGIPLTVTLSRASSVSVVALQTKPKVSVTIKRSLKAGKKTVLLIKSSKLHKGKVTITFKGGGNLRVLTTTLS